MKKINLKLMLMLFIGLVYLVPMNDLIAKERKGYSPVRMSAGVTNNFLQVNNINAVFRSDGYFNYDKIS